MTNSEQSSPPLVRRPGFVAGAAEVFSAARFLATNPNTWPLSLVPAVLFAVVGAAGTLAGWLWLTPWIMSFFAQPDSWWMGAAHWLAKALLYIASVIVGAWTALLLTPPLSSPALEGLVAIQEKELQVEARSAIGFWQELVFGLKAQLLAFGFAVPIVLGLWIVELVIPPLSVLITPLKAVVTALAIAWNLFDYPLTLRGVAASDRLSFVFTHWAALLGFGLVFGALFWVPCFGVLMLPVGAVAATRLLYRLLEADSAELPELPRPAREQLQGAARGASTGQ